MAVVDCDTLLTTGITAYEVGSTNLPMGKNPEGETIILVEEGSIEVVVMGADAVYQEIVAYERYGNTGMSKYSRAIFPSDPLIFDGGWSDWLKIG